MYPEAEVGFSTAQVALFRSSQVSSSPALTLESSSWPFSLGPASRIQR